MSAEHPSHEQLTAFQWGKLEAADQEAVSAHVANCEECCEALHQIPEGTLVGNLRATTVEGSEETDPLPLELRDHPRYQVGKFLGAGGMGLVYQAEHRLMNRVVALKILGSSLRTDAGIARFHREAQAIAKLKHPDIAAVFFIGQDDQLCYMAMEYVEGISLRELMRRLKASPADVS